MKKDFFSTANVFRFISRFLGLCSRQLKKHSDFISQYLNYDKYNPKLDKNKYASLTYNRSITGLAKGGKRFQKLLDRKLKEGNIELKSEALIKAHLKREWEFFVSFYNADLKDTDVVLDTGAYNTYFCVFLKDYVKKIYSTDSFYWAEREQWMAEVNKVDSEKLIAQEGDLMELPFGDNTFDKVFCISTIEHVKDDLRGMKEIRRVLKPGGLLLLTTEINRRLNKPYSETDGSCYRVYSYEQIMDLIKKSGFKLAGKNRLIETMDRSGEFCQALFVLRK